MIKANHARVFLLHSLFAYFLIQITLLFSELIGIHGSSLKENSGDDPSFCLQRKEGREFGRRACNGYFIMVCFVWAREQECVFSSNFNTQYSFTIALFNTHFHTCSEKASGASADNGLLHTIEFS